MPALRRHRRLSARRALRPLQTVRRPRSVLVPRLPRLGRGADQQMALPGLHRLAGVLPDHRSMWDLWHRGSPRARRVLPAVLADRLRRPGSHETSAALPAARRGSREPQRPAVVLRQHGPRPPRQTRCRRGHHDRQPAEAAHLARPAKTARTLRPATNLDRPTRHSRTAPRPSSPGSTPGPETWPRDTAGAPPRPNASDSGSGSSSASKDPRAGGSEPAASSPCQAWDCADRSP